MGGPGSSKLGAWGGLCLLAGWAASLGACAGNAPARENAQVAARPQAPPPTWKYQPISWSKLDDIERWLATPGAAADAALRCEARLQLAEGLLDYGIRERSKTEPVAFEARLAHSEQLLREAMGDEGLSPLQRERATKTLAKLLSARAPLPPLAAAPPSATDAAPTFPELIKRAQWGAQPSNPARLERDVGGWERITVHHSADSNGERAERSAKDSAEAVRSIQRYHMQEQHWGDIGYHFLIDPLGRIYAGRSLQWQGAHAGDNARNSHNLGVCLLGDYADESPPPLALKALDRLLDALCAKYTIAQARVYGHKEVKESTPCPGPYLLSWVKRYRGSRGAAVADAPIQPAASAKAEKAGAPKSGAKSRPQAERVQ